MKRYKTRMVDPEKLEYGAMRWVVDGAVDWAVYGAVDEAVYWAVHGAVGGEVSIK